MSITRDNRKIRVLIVDDIAETRDNLKKLLFFEDDMEVVGVASNGKEGVEQVANLRPDIVLMDINMPGLDGIGASETISNQYPQVQVIMMSVQGESDYLRRSMLAGAREFLIKPFSSEELATSIRRVYQLAATRRAMAPQPPPQASVETGGTNAAHAAPPKPQGCKIIAVFSPKGGSGVTTIAVNLAVALREETKGRVAIVDGSFQFGDVGVMLNLPSNRSIADVVDSKQSPDEDLLNGVMATHSSGIKALLAPPRPEMAELVTPDHVRSVLGVLQKMFDYVVVDTAKVMNDVQMAILDTAEQIVLVSTADISALKNTKLFFEVTEALEYASAKSVLILNKYDGHSGITSHDIEGNIKHPVSGLIPRDDRTVNVALNRGIPFIITQRGLPMSLAIIALATMLRRNTEETPAAASAKPSAQAGGKPAAPPKPDDKTKPKRGMFSFNKS
ncbi:MAG: response regulator [Anaerolineae bacterium]